MLGCHEICASPDAGACRVDFKTRTYLYVGVVCAKMLEPRSSGLVFSQANADCKPPLTALSKDIEEYLMDGAGKPWTLSSLALTNKVLLCSPDSCFACRKKQEDEGDDHHDEAIDTQTLEIMCKALVLMVPPRN